MTTSSLTRMPELECSTGYSTGSQPHSPCLGFHRPLAVPSSNGSRKRLTTASASSSVRANGSSDLLASAA
jgi:hypothetical protein